MRWTALITIILVGLTLISPWAVRGEPLSDSRYQLRRKAAKVLMASLKSMEGKSGLATEDIAALRFAVAEAKQMIDPKSHASAQLTAALQGIEKAEGKIDIRKSKSYRRLVSTAGELDFVPTIEADMPRGFPSPTPVAELELKTYPAYRMAKTNAEQSSGFWTLFQHIKTNKIAMTAPVEMEYAATGSGQGRPETMAFLYENSGLGGLGKVGDVTVVDVPSQQVVSIGVRGSRTSAKVQAAQQRLEEWLAQNTRSFSASAPLRVMGYNSPFVPTNRRYFEVQIPVESGSQIAAK